MSRRTAALTVYLMLLITAGCAFCGAAQATLPH